MAGKRAAVLGAGSWGTALAKVLVENEYDVRLWARSAQLIDEINARHENARYLPGIALPHEVTAHADLGDALRDVELAVVVVPSHALRELAGNIAELIPKGVPIVNAMKGIEQHTLELPSEILRHVLPAALHDQLTFLSGPSFAREVAMGVPTAVLMAGTDPDVTHRAQHAFGNQRLRVYSTDDVIGVELGGALKNVIAIAAGIADGMQFGHNSRAGIITRGLHEIGRLATRLGAHPLTMSGLSGMGDLVLTCTGDLSRNRHVGIELGKGRKLSDILAEMSMVAEGVRTAESAHALAQREGVEMPIVAGVYRILYQGADPHNEVEDLMARALRPERDH